MRHLFCLLLLLFSAVTNADDNETSFKKYLAKMEKLDASYSIGDIVIKSAKDCLDIPYIAYTLEKEPEQLVVNFDELDCTTFVETVVAKSLVARKLINGKNEPTYKDFCNLLTKLRYRNGKITDYTSRIHYFTDWIYENEHQGFVRDITKKAGGIKLIVKTGYMSAHPDKYKQLAKNPKFTDVIHEQENAINARSHYYIPQDKINKCGKSFKNGDIVCFVTDIAGLDVSHVGFIYWDKGKLTFIHASSTAGKVIINRKPLQEYVCDMKHNTGIIVVRIN